MNQPQNIQRQLNEAEIHEREIQSLQKQLNDIQPLLNQINENNISVKQKVEMIEVINKIREQKTMWKTMAISHIFFLVILLILFLIKSYA